VATDYVAEITALERDEFVRRHAGFFLVPDRVVARRRAAQPTVPMRRFSAEATHSPLEGRIAPKFVAVAAIHHLPMQSSVDVGREPGNAVVVEDQTLSRKHARIYVEGARPSIEDLGSLNGTFIRGTRVIKAQRIPLVVGDRIQFGSHPELTFTDAGGCWDLVRAQLV
jgi:hypothetical protein